MSAGIFADLALAKVKFRLCRQSLAAPELRSPNSPAILALSYLCIMCSMGFNKAQAGIGVDV